MYLFSFRVYNWVVKYLIQQFLQILLVVIKKKLTLLVVVYSAVK